MIFNEDSEVKIDIYKWKGEDEDRVDIEIDYGGFNSIELTVSTMKEADMFIKALKKANVKKHRVNEDGSLDE
jgi:hypothetical protein